MVSSLRQRRLSMYETRGHYNAQACRSAFQWLPHCGNRRLLMYETRRHYNAQACRSAFQWFPHCGNRRLLMYETRRHYNAQACRSAFQWFLHCGNAAYRCTKPAGIITRKLVAARFNGFLIAATPLIDVRNHYNTSIFNCKHTFARQLKLSPQTL